MTEVLSQDEIDQLLAVINAEDTEPENFTQDGRKIKIYDFKRPYKFTKEQIRIISSIHEIFARLTTNSISAQLRTMGFVHVKSVDQCTYEEFIRSIPTPTTIATINMAPLKGCQLMVIDLDITTPIIDRICGGLEKVTKYLHELTDIEQSIMEKIFVRMLGNIRKAWTTVLDLCPQLETIDTNPQWVQIVHPNEIVVEVTLEIQLSDVKGFIRICIPYSTVEPIIEKLSNSFWYGKNQNNKPIIKSSNLKNREDIPIRLTAEVLRRDYPVKEILKWDTETLILPLRPLSPGYCYLRLGDRRVWQCQILQDDKWFSKRITIIKYAEKPYGTEGNDMKKENVNPLAAEALSNAMIMISVELGTTLKTVKEVFEMGEGTIVELDKLAGEPLNVMANGVLFAKGEVVVIDENFGVRITEIIGNKDASKQDDLQQPAPEPSKPITDEEIPELAKKLKKQLPKDFLKETK